MTLNFQTYTLVAVYSPCTGYDNTKMRARKYFDTLLTKHMKDLQTKNRQKVLLTGDLNVNPRRQDSHPLAFVQCAKLKKQSGSTDDPG